VYEISLVVWNPSVAACEDALKGNLLRLLLGQLAAPAYAVFRVGSLATVVVLQVSGGLHGFRTPLVPSFRKNLTGQVAVHKQSIAIIAPRATKINLVCILRCADVAIIKYVPVHYIFWRRGCGDVGVDFAEDVAVLEPRCRRTEDEVGGSFDIAILEV
jgi:hypothetical protein